MPALRSRRPHAILLVAAVLLTLLHPRPAAAATEGRLVMVLDSSGSMADKIDGGSKIAVAKRALNTVVDHLPDDAQVGLRVYGANVDDENDPAACTDSELVVPIGAGNKEALRTQIARYRPLGETPISYSLKEAAKDLGGSGRRTVVLVSDGRESCGGDPCVTAANLAAQGVDLKFDVIGLAVSGATRSQLQCIADRGRGTYYDAKNARQIEDSLDQLATRAYRPFQLTGDPVEGNEDQAKAPEVRPGQYLDRLAGRQNRKIWYRIPRTASGSTIHVGVTARSTGNGSSMMVNLAAPDDSYCSFDSPQDYQGLVSGAASSYKADPDSVCNTADHLLVSVSPSSQLVGASFELVVIEEPPLASDRDLPPYEKPAWQPMPSTAAGPAPVPGLSLSDAPVLTSGSYRSSVLTGETQVFAVDLDWGQRLQVQTVVAPRRGALARELGGGDKLSLGVVGADRDTYVLLRATNQPRDVDFGQDEEAAVQSAATPAIRYLDRTDFDAQPGELPGRTYVVVTMNRFAHDTAFLVPYTLKVAVSGTAGDGAPAYLGAGSASPSATAAPTPSVLPSEPPAASSGVSLAAAVGIGVGALVLGAASTGVALAVRRRRRRTAG